ncbi:PD40 domain-containing protein [Gramella sp. KN1008]|uniref:PD40 domain-containing protein n=1 Tax=Gramella sp. KN1008 TaxID=2529298 RepID=UPI00103E4634|nr:PD40 domain-containing protein [Gramella sp. KN1008]TBW26540.1 hypothetical protein EZJ28_14140 [Gramella sp. KN1008]
MSQLPEVINSSSYEVDVFVAPDEYYVIFSANRKKGNGRGDLYISFKTGKNWSSPKNMGSAINNKNHQLCPFVTRDGKNLFYTSDNDIYWVSSKVIDELKRTKG